MAESRAELQKSLRFTTFITVLNAVFFLYIGARMAMTGGGQRPEVGALGLVIFAACAGGGVWYRKQLAQKLGALGD